MTSVVPPAQPQVVAGGSYYYRYRRTTTIRYSGSGIPGGFCGPRPFHRFHRHFHHYHRPCPPPIFGGGFCGLPPSVPPAFGGHCQTSGGGLFSSILPFLMMMMFKNNNC